MRYFALATDYDGTIAYHGAVDTETLAALQRVRDSGRRLIMVSGRQLDDLSQVFNRWDLFDLAVLENGALLYVPATREKLPLAAAPDARLIEELTLRRVQPLMVGDSILATWEPHETTVLKAIRDLGLEYHVIFNKGAVMILPSGTNKETGLRAALDRLGLSAHNCVGVGDAENDHAFLTACEFSAAVANALPAIKERVDFVTPRDHGQGVQQLIEHLLADDLEKLGSRISRYDIEIGKDDSGAAVTFNPFGESILIAGPSGSGKSTASTGIIERLAEKAYQFCLIDPEGDYDDFAAAVAVGNAEQPPIVDAVFKLLAKPDGNVVVNLLGVKLADRPAFFAGFLPRLLETRQKTGRPHWIIVDEAHHLLPRNWHPAAEGLPKKLNRAMLVTVHPDYVSPEVLEQISIVIAVGDQAEQTLGAFALNTQRPTPRIQPRANEAGEVCVWFAKTDRNPLHVKVTPGKSERRRHRRKYARGDLGPDQNFVFTGPSGALNLRAQNLVIFMQMAEGVDDATWEFHLRRGDISTWFRTIIKDDELADATRAIEENRTVSPKEGRALLRKEIEERYTLPG